MSETHYRIRSLLALGMTNRQIAIAVGRSHHTVRVHVSRIFAELGVQNRTQAAIKITGETKC